MGLKQIILEDSTNSGGYFNKSNSVWAEALSPYMNNGVFNEGLDVRLQVNENTYETLTVDSPVYFSSEGSFASENYLIVVNPEDIYMEDNEAHLVSNATIKIALFEEDPQPEPEPEPEPDKPGYLNEYTPLERIANALDNGVPSALSTKTPLERIADALEKQIGEPSEDKGMLAEKDYLERIAAAVEGGAGQGSKN